MLFTLEGDKAIKETALLVHVILPGDPVDSKESLSELESLAKAADVEVMGNIRQKRNKVNSSLYIGKGKAELIAEIAHEKKVDVVIFDNDLSPAQIRELEKIIEVKIIDRSELILDIFATRASSAEARMQVELAQLEYTYPRLTRMWSHLDTVAGSAATGGVGTRGTGESQLEIDRRLVHKRVAALSRQIKEIDKRKTRQVKARDKHFTVSLVGYTNAGKSTLMNTLTGSENFAADQLFATLDTKTQRWNLSQEHYALLSDTVGFVRNLPHHLVASFRATLEEAIHADLLLHVVDIAHPQVELQLKAVNTVLKELGCDQKDIILVMNKIDKPGSISRSETFQAIHPDAVAVSSRTGSGVNNLIDAVLTRITGDNLHLRVTGNISDGRISHYLRAHGTILKEDYSDTHVTIEAQLGQRQLPGLKQLKPESCEIITPTKA
ncbi:MAG: GTPase HflX [Phycisphaerae bacterium]|nr:GTPase HflX [Phycisphaerae bacterium]